MRVRVARMTKAARAIRCLTLSFGFVLAACEEAEPIAKLSGTVVDMYGSPAGEVQVRVGDAAATTNAAGQFVITNVDAPYDVAVLPENRGLFLYAGLESETPTLRVDGFVLGATSSRSKATLVVDFGDAEHGYLIERPDGQPFAQLLTSQLKDGSRVFTITWEGVDAVDVRVRAFRYQEDANGAPAHYTGSATTTLSLEPLTSISWTAEWAPPSFGEKTLSFSASLPDDYKAWQTSLDAKTTGAINDQAFAWSHASADALSFVVPDLDDLSFGATVCAGNGASNDCASVPHIASGDVVEVERGPAFTSVGADDVLEPGSTIAWSRESERPVFVTLWPEQEFASAPPVFMATGDDSIEMPDLVALGLEWRTGAKYTIGVFQSSAHDTIEELTAGDFGARPSADGHYAYSSSRIVTLR